MDVGAKVLICTQILPPPVSSGSPLPTLYLLYAHSLQHEVSPRCRRALSFNPFLALRIADRYGLTFEYKVARRHGLSPVEALDEWDMLTDEACRLLCT